MVEIQTIIYGLYAWGLLATAGVIMLGTLTPAIPFLLARFAKNKAVLAVIHKGNRLSFVIGKYNAGSFKTKKFGQFDETAQSTYLAFKTPMYFAPEYYSHTMPHKYPMMIQAAKNAGFEFQNLDEFMAIAKDEKHKKKELTLANGETVRMGDLLHMFPSIDDPHVREKEKASEVLIAKGLSGGQDLKKWLILLFIGAVIAFIVWKLFLGGQPEQAVNVVCKYPDILNATTTAAIPI